jgi:hypothetical protein
MSTFLVDVISLCSRISEWGLQTEHDRLVLNPCLSAIYDHLSSLGAVGPVAFALGTASLNNLRIS